MLSSTIEKGRCKQILKASSTSGKVALGVGNETQEEYERIMGRLEKFKKESKKATKTNSQKAAWHAENETLVESINKNESDLSKMMNQLLLNAIGDEKMNIHHAIEQSSEFLSSREQVKCDVWNQFKDLKSLMYEIIMCLRSSHFDFSSLFTDK